MEIDFILFSLKFGFMTVFVDSYYFVVTFVCHSAGYSQEIPVLSLLFSSVDICSFSE